MLSEELKQAIKEALTDETTKELLIDTLAVLFEEYFVDREDDCPEFHSIGHSLRRIADTLEKQASS